MLLRIVQAIYFENSLSGEIPVHLRSLNTRVCAVAKLAACMPLIDLLINLSGFCGIRCVQLPRCYFLCGNTLNWTGASTAAGHSWLACWVRRLVT